MAEPSTVPAPNLGNVAGPPFLGIFINGYLFGLLTLQYYNYCLHFRNDMKWLKNLVHIQFVLEAAQTIMSLMDGFHWFVYGYGDLRKLSEFYLANIDSPILCSIIALISQGVYCWRIYHLSRWKAPMVVIGLAACGQAVGGFGIGIVNQKLGSILKWQEKFDVFLILWSVCSAVADTVIACSMSYFLLSSECFNSSRSTVVARLIRLVIETNVASALVAISLCLTTVIKPIAPPKTSYFMLPGYVLGKLYSNSFIIMLNNRSPHGRGGADDTGVRTATSIGELFSMSKRRHWKNPSRPTNPESPPNLSVAIHTETAVHLECSSQCSSQWMHSGQENTPKPRSVLPEMV